MNSELPSLLRTPEGPWLLEFVGTPAKAYEFAWAVAKHGIASRVLRGSKMATLQATFDEIGAGLQFPQYFGENQAALAECITDMSWLPAEAYVVVVADAIRLLEHDSDDRFAMLVETFSEAGPEWATPIERGEWWDRPARPFHVVLQVEAESREELRSRFEATEAELARWEDWRQAPTATRGEREGTARQASPQVRDAIVEEVLAAALEDPVMLTDLEWFVTRARSSDGVEPGTDEIVGTGIEVLKLLLEDELAVAGTPSLEDDFEPWTVDAETALARIESGWRAAGDQLEIGDVAWIALTAKGEAKARAAGE